MRTQKSNIALIMAIAILLTTLTPLLDGPSRAETLNSLYVGDFIDDMILDESRGYMYATIGEDSKLAFISLDNMQIEKEIPLSSYPYDAELYNGKLYLALSIERKIVSIDLETKEIDNTYQMTNKPNSFVIDDNQIFFVTGEQSSYLYEYNMSTGEEKTITVGNDNYTTYAGPDLVIDRTNNVLYIGESGSSGSHIDAISTVDYSRISKSTYDDGYGFPFSYRNVILDGEDIFYAGRKFDKNNLAIIHGMYINDGIERYEYDENIVFVKNNYVITDQSIYDRNTFEKLASIPDDPYDTKRIVMDSSHNIYIVNWDTMSIEKKSLDLSSTNSEHYNLGNVLFLDNAQLHDWVYDELNDTIYALSDASNKLLFINGNDLTIETEVIIGSLPSDIEIYDNKIYISLFGATKIAVVDISTKQIEDYITLNHNPYKIAMDNNKIFYVEEDQHLNLYEYDLATGTEKELQIDNDRFSVYEADLAIDRLNDILYIAESGSSGSNIQAINIVNYTQESIDTYDDGYGFSYPERRVILDGDDIFYASHKLNKNDLSEIYGKYQDAEFTYDEDIIYAVGNYVFSKNAIYNRDSFKKIANSPSDLVISDSQGKVYLYDDSNEIIYTFDYIEQINMDYPRNFNAVFNETGNLELSWNEVTGAEGYNIYYEYATEPSRPIKLNSELVTGTVCEEVYLNKWYDNVVWFGATAVIQGKESTISEMDFKFFESAVKAPTNFNINYNESEGEVRFNWDADTTVDGYNLYYRYAENEDFIKLNTSLITDTVHEAVYGEVYDYDWYNNTIDFGLTATVGQEESSYNIKSFSFFDDVDDNTDSNDNGSGNSSNNTGDNDTIREDNIINEDGSVNLDNAASEDSNVEEDGTTSNTVDIDEEKLEDIIENLQDEEELKLEVDGEADKIIIKLPGKSYNKLNGKGNGKKIIFSTPNGTYVLPANTIDISQYLSKSDKVTIEIEISKINDDEIISDMETDGLELIGQPIEFAVKINDGEEVYEVKSFGNQYIERWIELKEKPNKITTVGIVYDEKTKEYKHVPTKFQKKDGKHWAVLKRNGNSIYAVVSSTKEFTDINNHWAKEDIELMTSKLIAKGMTETEFAPDEKITRAQYVSLLIRALGLTYEDKTGINFKDIDDDVWYTEAVKTAVEYGFVSGYEDGTFKPNKTISREEMAVITVRALEFIEGKQSSNVYHIDKFVDVNEIDSWAENGVAIAVKFELMNGKDEGRFDPNSNTTRAESVVLLKRLLEKLDFIEQ